MALLPTARNTTYGAASQIKSADLNDIQDCIVGNKHPPLELLVPASKAVPDVNANGTYNASCFWSAFAGAGLVHIPIEVPVGKRIVSVEQFYSINGTGNPLVPKFRRRQLLTGAVTLDVVAGASDNTGAAAAIESQVLTANHVVVSGFEYFMEISVAAGNQRVHAVKVIFDAL